MTGAPGSGFYNEIALRQCPPPCNPKCTERTATCKFDGSCEKYNEWKPRYADTMEAIKSKYAQAQLGTALSVERFQLKRYRDAIAYHRKLDRK